MQAWNTQRATRREIACGRGWFATALSVCTALGLGVSDVDAAELNVPGDYPTIQAAINAAAAGDTVLVAPGVYNEQIDFLGKSLRVAAVSTVPAQTIIDANGAGRAVRMVGFGTGAELEGFLIVNGSAGTGGGIRVEGPAVIRNCEIQQCVATTFGGGVWASGDPKFEDCEFRLNSANNGGGVRVADEARFYRCHFLANSATTAGGAVHVDGSIIMEDCLLADENSAPDAASIFIDGSGSSVVRTRIDGILSPATGTTVTVTGEATFANTKVSGGAYAVDVLLGPSTATLQFINCTLVNQGSAALRVPGPSIALTVLVRNSILWSTGVGLDAVQTPFVNAQYSNIKGGWPGLKNLNVDPAFLFPTANNHALQRTSPCIDAGKNSFATAYGATDSTGKDRFVANPVVEDTGFGDAEPIDLGAEERPAIVRYVKASATGANNGSSWADAYVDLQDALDEANLPFVSDYYILVAEGNYRPDRGTNDRSMSFEIKRFFWVVGGFAGVDEDHVGDADWTEHPTTLGGAIGGAGTADNSYHVLRTQPSSGIASDALVQGFIIQRGNANGVPADASNRGGAILATGGTVRFADCIFRENEADSTGGVVRAEGLGTAIFERCRFYANISRGTGSVMSAALDAKLSVADSLIHGNDSVERAAIFVDEDGSLFMKRSTLADNISSAGNTGGILVQSGGTAILQGSIVWKNQGSSGTLENQNIRTFGDLLIDYCTVQGWSGAFNDPTSNGLNPQFIAPFGVDRQRGTLDDDYRLSATSPMIDSGYYLLDTAVLDLDRNDRLVDLPDVINTGAVTLSYVDRGCYEVQPSPCLGDLDESGVVDAADLAILLGAWGTGAGAADLDGSGSVNGADLAVLLGAWGPC